GAGALLAGGGPGDDGAQRDEGGPVGDRLRLLDRRRQGVHVLPVLPAGGPVHALRVPAVGVVAGDHVLGERHVRVALDGDVVVVPEDDQVAQLLGAGQRGGLGGDTLLQVTVGGDHVHPVVERGGALGGVRVEQTAHPALGERHPHGGGQSLAERSGGGLHTRGVPHLGVPRGQRAPGAQRLDVGQLQTVAGQVELDVL